MLDFLRSTSVGCISARMELPEEAARGNLGDEGRTAGQGRHQCNSLLFSFQWG